MHEECRNALPKDTMLDTYRIERVLGVGGFGITYLAYELNLGKAYAIKELLPDGLAIREAGSDDVVARSVTDQADFDATRERFISEARVLAAIEHRSVVGVHRLMEEHGTCYMVMDYVEGVTLDVHLKGQGGKLQGLEEFKRLFYPILDGLDLLHSQGLVHRDVKPGNIMVKPNGKPVLLDFGTVTKVLSKTLTVTQMVSAGYSPFEQYTTKARQGPYTDIYAMGATMVRSITGKKPDDSSDRVLKDRYEELHTDPDLCAVYSEPVLKSVDAAMRMEAGERPQSISAWSEMLESVEGGDPAEAPQQSGQSKPSEDAQPVEDFFSVTGIEVDDEVVPPRSGGVSKGLLKFVAFLCISAAVAGWWYVYEQPRRVRVAIEQEFQGYVALARKELANDQWEKALGNFKKALLLQPNDKEVLAELERLQRWIANVRGDVIVTTVPNGAAVSMQGHPEKRSPASFVGVKLGEYQVQVKKLGYDPVELDLTVRRDKTTELGPVMLARSYGSVSISCKPAGTKFLLKQVKSDVANDAAFVARLGLAPSTELKLPSGEYLVRVEKDGWPSFEKKFRVEGGKQYSFEHAFATGTLVVGADPAKVDYLLYKDAPDRVVKQKELAEHREEYKIKGLPAERNKFLRERIAQLELELKSLVGELVAEGVTPIRMELASGKYLVKLSTPGFKSTQVDVEVKGNETVTKRVVMEEFPVGNLAGDRRYFEIYPKVKVAFRWCPPTGSDGFMVGSPKGEASRESDEQQHKVVLTKGFWLAETECTQAQWQAVMGKNPGKHKNAGGKAPVEQVTWDEVKKFMAKLQAGGTLNKELRATLPTEAQWEYACRAGSREATYFGNRLSSNQANVNGQSPYGGAAKGANKGRPVVVKSYPANRWGLYDMHGNVWEWVFSIYEPYTSTAKTDPLGPQKGWKRVIRGGSWKQGAKYARSANRGSFWSHIKHDYLGFRISLQVPRQ